MKKRNGKLENGQKVFVYRNLHTGTWSVKDKESNRVVRHTNAVYLRDVDFKVSKAGLERVRKEGRKNVHAGVLGFVDDVAEEMFEIYNSSLTEVTYNPYRYDSFVIKQTEQPIYEAQMVMLVNNKVYIYDAPNHI